MDINLHEIDEKLTDVVSSVSACKLLIDRIHNTSSNQEALAMVIDIEKNLDSALYVLKALKKYNGVMEIYIDFCNISILAFEKCDKFNELISNYRTKLYAKDEHQWKNVSIIYKNMMQSKRLDANIAEILSPYLTTTDALSLKRYIGQFNECYREANKKIELKDLEGLETSVRGLNENAQELLNLSKISIRLQE